MRKVVYNSCYGGFSLSLKAQKRYLEKKGHSPKLYDTGKWYMKHYYIEKPHDFYDRNIKRHDEDLVAVVVSVPDFVSRYLTTMSCTASMSTMEMKL